MTRNHLAAPVDHIFSKSSVAAVVVCPGDNTALLNMEQSDNHSDSVDTVSTVQVDKVLSPGDFSILNVQVSRFRKVTIKYETFVLFEIITMTRSPGSSVSEFKVERRYSDFEWLRSKLVELYPALFVPPLPGKMVMTSLDHFSEPFLVTRCSGLQTFLKRMSRHPLLSADPIFTKFLMSKEDFSSHRSSHSAVDKFLNFMSNATHGLLGSSATDNEGLFLNSPEAQHSFIVPSAIRHSGDEFRGFTEENNVFLAITRRLARCTGFIANQLDDLSGEFSDLSRCLEVWPSSLVVDGVEKRSADTSGGTSDSLSSWVAEPPLGGPMRLDLDSQRPVPPRVIAHVSKLVALETRNMATQLRADTALKWQDIASYAESIRSVLRSREHLQSRFVGAITDMTTDVRSHAYNDPHGGYVAARGYFLWRSRPNGELIADVNRLQDKVTFFNQHIRAEYDRWRSERQEEVVDIMSRMACCYANYWTRVANIWRSAIVKLDSGCADESMLDETAVESQDVVPEVQEPAGDVSQDSYEPVILSPSDCDAAVPSETESCDADLEPVAENVPTSLDG